MRDRGMIKWAPFASVISGKEVLQEISEEKSIRTKPVLSDEQIEKLEHDLIESCSNSSIVDIYFYESNHIHKITGIITKIDPVSKKITINAKKSLFFSNIIRISTKNT